MSFTIVVFDVYIYIYIHLKNQVLHTHAHTLYICIYKRIKYTLHISTFNHFDKAKKYLFCAFTVVSRGSLVRFYAVPCDLLLLLSDTLQGLCKH